MKVAHHTDDHSAETGRRADMVRRLTDALREIRRKLDDLGEDPFDAVTGVALRHIQGVDAASCTVYRHGEFRTVATTSDQAWRADQIQYELGTGPCVDAIVEDAVFHPTDLATDHRWPEYGQRVSAELGWSSMLSYRLSTDDVIGGLNLYGAGRGAFDDVALQTGLLLAVHTESALSASFGRRQTDNLKRALDSSREIGAAQGVLMARYQLTQDQAFELLRNASQHTNRKVREIATVVLEIGELPDAAARNKHAATRPPAHGR